VNEQLANAMIVLTVVIDPLGCALIFAGLSRDLSPDERRRTAIRGATLAGTMLVLFLFIGDGLLRSLGIGLAAFRIAGGALLFLLAVDMVFVRRSGIRSVTPRERVEAEVKEDISVFPLAFPLIAGPGALTTVLLYAAAIPPFSAQTWMLLGIIAMVVTVTLGCLLASHRIMRLIGETGANVVSRMLGLILTALATQFILDGINAGLKISN
jgi:multiple antibiotic resistance protein